MVCVGKDKTGKCFNRVLKVKVVSFQTCVFPFMVKPRSRLSLANLNNDIRALGVDVNHSEVLKRSITSIEIYSNTTIFWHQQYTQIEEKFSYFTCLF